MMKVTINDEEKTLDSGSSLEDLISQVNLDMQKIAIELNLSIIARSQYADTILQDGDRLEIVHFIGGG